MRFGQGSGSETKGRHSRWSRDHDYHDCDSVIVMINQIMGVGTQGDLKMINIGNIEMAKYPRCRNWNVKMFLFVKVGHEGGLEVSHMLNCAGGEREGCSSGCSRGLRGC